MAKFVSQGRTGPITIARPYGIHKQLAFGWLASLPINSVIGPSSQTDAKRTHYWRMNKKLPTENLALTFSETVKNLVKYNINEVVFTLIVRDRLMPNKPEPCLE